MRSSQLFRASASTLISRERQHRHEKRRDPRAACIVSVSPSQLQMKAVKLSWQPDLEMGRWTTRPSSCVNVASSSHSLGPRCLTTTSATHTTLGSLPLPGGEFTHSDMARSMRWRTGPGRSRRLLCMWLWCPSLACSCTLFHGDRLRWPHPFPSYSHLFLSFLSPSLESVSSKQIHPSLTSAALGGEWCPSVSALWWRSVG